jgi:hypothetical protein
MEQIRPVVKSKEKVSIPDGFYVGRVGGWELTILSKDQYGKEFPLESGIRTQALAVVVHVVDGIAYCFDRGFNLKMNG